MARFLLLLPVLAFFLFSFNFAYSQQESNSSTSIVDSPVDFWNSLSLPEIPAPILYIGGGTIITGIYGFAKWRHKIQVEKESKKKNIIDLFYRSILTAYNIQYSFVRELCFFYEIDEPPLVINKSGNIAKWRQSISNSNIQKAIPSPTLISNYKTGYRVEIQEPRHEHNEMASNLRLFIGDKIITEKFNHLEEHAFNISQIIKKIIFSPDQNELLKNLNRFGCDIKEFQEDIIKYEVILRDLPL